jgi:hypothetical protein
MGGGVLWGCWCGFFGGGGACAVLRPLQLSRVASSRLNSFFFASVASSPYF